MNDDPLTSDAIGRFSLKDKVVLVTGASSGIGAHLAKTAASAGARVVIGARRLKRLEHMQMDISWAGGHVLGVAMDVTDRTSVEAAFDSAEAHFGVVDVVLNNAGIGNGQRALDISEEDWRSMLSTNLDGVWRTAQCAAQRLVKAGKPGSIINIASILGLRAGTGYSHYSAAKAGVVQLTQSLALDLARYGVRVNTIAPGYFKTEMNDAYFDSDKGQAYIRTGVPLGRLGLLEELEGPFLLLASQAGSFITGATLAVDGGHLVSSL
ncbi:SDR family oxidoreductase [Pseudomonas lactis]|uniref:SDR family NAD(P)-dependent oxidoreductase n=1 Tax=Pseudomonas lactis TaxID=1615674 RepID=UPI00054B0F65|nr:SDR family NAD(P)-dependent oxidoreductase [Pseudomonas lactis]MDR8373561.1 SDR family oxidoreductase [Pseudomonas lactis]